MYMSRFELNSRRSGTAKALASPQVLHAAVEAAFPACASADKRNLWRIDRLSDALYLLVLSRQQPDFTHMAEQFGWPDSGRKGESYAYDAFLERIAAGQNWRFRLCANPVHSVQSEERERGKVYSHVTAEQQKQWLADRAEKNGFTLDGLFEVVKRDIKRFSRGGRTVTLGTATFEGILAVKDAALLRNALTRGIGRAKAYGCGLMTLAKPV
jgi:CRISPR system Cascade subunit CasE